jgi:hypothetical protein
VRVVLDTGTLITADITLILIPAFYLVVEDVHDLFGVRSGAPESPA